MLQIRPRLTLALALTLFLPGWAVAGPPLICHPFQTAGAPLLPWGNGPGWNSPDPRYETERLVVDVQRLLDEEAPVLARMENLRRAAIYASRDHAVAQRLLDALLSRARRPGATRLALFDAGYLIETYKQATHLFGRRATTEDGYALVSRAIGQGPAAPEMEFAASLMSEGAAAAAHLRRARSAAVGQPLLARNIQAVWEQ